MFTTPTQSISGLDIHNSVISDQQQLENIRQIPKNDTSQKNIHDTWDDIPLSMAYTVHGYGRKLTGVVKEQINCLKTKSAKLKALKLVKEGQFWEIPTFIKHSDVKNLKHLW